MKIIIVFCVFILPVSTGCSKTTSHVFENPARQALRKRNFKQALTLAQTEALTGDPEALYLMGRMYQLGWGVEKNWSVARTNLAAASAKGHARASVVLAVVESRTRDNQLDVAQALKKLDKAKDQDDPVIRGGRGLIALCKHEHPTLANFADVTVGADAGDPEAQLVVGGALLQAPLDDPIFKRDPAKGRDYLLKAAHSDCVRRKRHCYVVRE